MTLSDTTLPPHLDPAWQERAAALIERAPVGLLSLAAGLSGDPQLLYANRQALTLLGLPRDAAGSRRALPLDIVHPDDRPILMTAFRQALSGSEPMVWEGRLGRGDQERWIRIEAAARHDASSGEMVLEGMISDISGSRDSLASVALAITEAIPVGTYTMVLRPGAPLAHFSFLSERFLEICGLRREDALADPMRAFACVHPDDFDDWLRRNAEVFASKAPFTGECRLVVSGEVRWIRAESVPRDLPDGTTVWEGVLIDVTDRVLAQRQLQDSEAKLRQILDNLPIPVFCQKHTCKGELVFINPRLTAVLGYQASDIPNAEAIGRCFFPDPAYRRDILGRWIHTLQRADAQPEQIESIECEVIASDGSRRDVVLSSLVVGDLVVSCCLDITARKMAERALAASMVEERAREESQRRLLHNKLRTSLTASAVAHEINQPLSTIRLLCERAMLENQIAPRGCDKGGLDALLRSLLEESERVVAITEKMRMLLRNVETQHQPVDLTAISRGALTYMKRLLHDHGVRTELEGFEQGPVVISGDPVQLQIAIGNLLRNACEALQERSVAQRVIALRLQRSRERVELRLSDSGPGFPSAILERNREDQGLLSSTKLTGSGLGLYVVRTTLTNHGGDLSLGRCSRLGGAEVRLVLPLPQIGSAQG